MPVTKLRPPTHTPLHFIRLSPQRFTADDTSSSSSNRTSFERRTAEMSSSEARPAVRGSGTQRHVTRHSPHEARAARETDVRTLQGAASGCITRPTVGTVGLHLYCNGLT